MPTATQAFRVERRGIQRVPADERWATARDVGAMWAGASIQVEYLIYGAVLMTFGFTLLQALAVIVVGNLSFALLGACSLQGPQAGTATFAINRAPFGPHGSRPISFFNWISQIGFEVTGLILVVGAGLALATQAGFDPGSPAKAVIVVVAVVIQGVLPFLGHATILRTLRALIVPFVVLFVVLAVFAAPHVRAHGVAHGADWQTVTEGLAFTITLCGLGWAECGNDYTRYCSTKISRTSIVGWVLLGTALPATLIMALGAAIGTFLAAVGTAANAFLPFLHQGAIPAWFVTIFLIVSIAQLFAINSLDMYSSGVTLQAMGFRVQRYQAVLVDCALSLAVTLYAVFNASFATYLRDFVDVLIVWIAPWSAILLVDWLLRRRTYAPAELQRTDRRGLYSGCNGIAWPAVLAQAAGMVAAIASLAATFRLPAWLNSVTWATRDPSGHGADFSVFLGMGVGGLAYLVLARGRVRRQAARQDDLLAAPVTEPSPAPR